MNTYLDLSSFEEKPSIPFKSAMSKMKDSIVSFLNPDVSGCKNTSCNIIRNNEDVYLNNASLYFHDQASIFLSEDTGTYEKSVSDINYYESVYSSSKELEYLLLEQEINKTLKNIKTDLEINTTSSSIRKISPTNTAIGRIRTLSMYEDGWNGIDSVGAQKKTVLEAEGLARLMFKNTIRKPSISLASDGEINFYWNFNRNILDLGVFGDGYYSYYFRSNEGKEIFADDRPIKSIVDDEILKIVTV